MTTEHYDFEVLETQILLCYGRNKETFDRWEVIDFLRVFKHFVMLYEEYEGTHHPQMPNSFVLRIMKALNDGEQEPEEYTDWMTEMYFNRYFNGNEQGECNHSMIHFVSGDIRLYLAMKHEIDGYDY